MTRSFIRRAAIAAALLPLGLLSVWGDNSLYDQFIARYDAFQIAIVLGALSAFWIALILWVCAALRFPPGGHWRDLKRGKVAAVVAVVSAACVSAQPCQAWTLVPTGAAQVTSQAADQAAEIDQPFILSPEQQRQVDSAIAEAGQRAKGDPGFTVTIELAIGIFIAAVLIGTTLYVVVRTVCKSYERIRESLERKLARLKEFLADPGKTNAPAVILGAAFFNHRPATTNDLPTGAELVVGFTASEEPPVLTAVVPVGETVSFDEFLADFGVVDRLPDDSWSQSSWVGAAIARAASGNGYIVNPGGTNRLVKLAFESCTNLFQNAWSGVLSLRVPAGALVDFADLTGNAAERYWRVGVAR